MRSFEVHPRLRVAALVTCSSGIAVRGLSYLDMSKEYVSLSWIDGLLPLQGWMTVWLLAAALTFCGIWDRRLARWAMSLGSSLWALWGLNYILAWVFMDHEFAARTWMIGSIMLMASAMTWILGALMDSIGPPPGRAVPEDGALYVEEK